MVVMGVAVVLVLIVVAGVSSATAVGGRGSIVGDTVVIYFNSFG